LICLIALLLGASYVKAAEPEKIDLWEVGKAPDGNGGFTDEEAFILVHRP
jgi:hypothetical protein